MSYMSKRATFALDEETVQRIKKLAGLMNISQAEVVRRAVALAEEKVNETEELKIERIETYHKKGGIAAEKAEEYLAEVRDNRSFWGRNW
ncbi:MAG: ribbon-helix-helix protein, CopG family [Spirochaetaceae bacterium]